MSVVSTKGQSKNAQENSNVNSKTMGKASNKDEFNTTDFLKRFTFKRLQIKLKRFFSKK